jgi:lactate dehydrogenase-like 2-hydroxyacid dehydrogenase
LPCVQREIDRRRSLQQQQPKQQHHQEQQQDDDDDDRPQVDYSTIRLIHAPTTELLLREVATAHVALPFMERFPADLFVPSSTSSPDLRLVMQYGVGLEGVDIPAATRAGIAVSNVPADGTGNAQATSEHAVFLAVSLLRQAQTEYHPRFQNRSLGGLPIPKTIYRKNVTVVGYGAVGSCLSRYLVTMGANVAVVRRRPWTDTHDDDDDDRTVRATIRKYDALSDALPNTDVLFLACPLTSETHHCLNEQTIALLPKGALVVNVARGGLVEYHAMVDALRSGAVGGFASDVGIGHPTKPSEPWDPDDPISNLPNVLFTPHVGGYSDTSYEAMAHKVVDAIENVMDGRPPPVWVNRPSP